MVTSLARVRTKYARDYLAELSRAASFGRAAADGTKFRAEIAWADGSCELDANGDDLDITLTAKSISDATLLESLISDRLDRLGSGEDLQYRWSRNADAPFVISAKPARAARAFAGEAASQGQTS